MVKFIKLFLKFKCYKIEDTVLIFISKEKLSSSGIKAYSNIIKHMRQYIPVHYSVYLLNKIDVLREKDMNKLGWYRKKED